MKRKFDILFEEILNNISTLDDIPAAVKSYTQYTVIGGKIQQYTKQLQALPTFGERLDYVKSKWQTNLPGDRSALRNTCYSLYGDDESLNPLYVFLKPYEVLPACAKVNPEDM